MQEDSSSETSEDFQAIGGEVDSVYEIIVREMEDAVFLIDVEQTEDGWTFRFRRNNASHQQLTGFSEDELRGQTPQELLGEKQGATVAANYRRCVEQGTSIQYDETLELPAGTSHWQTKLSPITNDGQVTQIAGVARDITEQKEREQKLQRLDRQFETVLETMSSAVFLKDTDGQYLLMNQACQELLGVEDLDIVGLTDADLFSPEVAKKASKDDRQVIENGEIIELEEEVPTATGNTVRLTRKSPVYDDEGEITGICGVSTDITQQKKREKTLQEMYKVGSNTDLAFDERVNKLIEIGREFLDLPYGFFTSIDGQTQKIVHARGSHDLLQSGESAPLEKSYCRKTVESDGLVGMENAEQILGTDDPAYDLFGLGCYIGAKVRVGSELYGTFCFAGPENIDRSFTDDEQEIVKLLGQWTGYELEQSQVETRLRKLHEVAQKLLVSEDTSEVASLGLKAAGDIFDLRIGACWEYNAAADELQPLTETAQARKIVGDTPTFERDEALVWESFDAGEIQIFADVSSVAETHNEETSLRSEVHIPLGDHGVMIFASTEKRSFDEIDIEKLRLLSALVTEAITAVKREQQLAERGEALQRQNKRLEEFADIVAHDLRNPLAGAVGFLEMARETDQPGYYDRVDQSLNRMEELIDELLMIARGDSQATNVHTLQFRPIVDEAWSYTDAPEESLSVDDALGEIEADETRLLQLLGNLFRNSVEHGGEEVSVIVGRLNDDDGFYVADDGPGFSDDSLTDIENLDGSDITSGTGIGLMSVLDVVDAHGWNLRIPDVEEGARIEIRTAHDQK